MERTEFNDQVTACLPTLRNLVRKQIGHPEQTDDVVQEALTKGWEKRESYKKDAAFCTWLCAIALHTGLDYLREQQRWRANAQGIYAYHCMNIPEWGMEIGQSFENPEIEYDVNEHIAYCFSCVGRSLDPVQQAALMLKDVLGLTSMEAGKVLGQSESVFRQHLSLARASMQQQYENLCALVNKKGVCYQCKGLRDGFPAGRNGVWQDKLDNGLDFDLRIKIVSNANLDNGKTKIMHELFWKRTLEQEEKGMGEDSIETGCGS